MSKWIKMMRTHSQEMWKRVCSLQGQQSSLENEEATVKKTCANLGSASQVKNSDCDCEGLCIYPLSNRSLTLKLLLKSNAPIGFPWRICVLCLLARAYLPSLVVVWYPHVCRQTPQTIFQECWRKMAKISSIYEGNPCSFSRQPGEGGLSEARGPGGQWWIGAKSENGSKGKNARKLILSFLHRQSLLSTNKYLEGESKMENDLN